MAHGINLAFLYTYKTFIKNSFVILQFYPPGQNLILPLYLQSHHSGARDFDVSVSLSRRQFSHM